MKTLKEEQNQLMIQRKQLMELMEMAKDNAQRREQGYVLIYTRVFTNI